jgi:hypothetical protein
MWVDWVEFDQNQNPNYIGYSELDAIKYITTRYNVGPGWLNPLIFGLGWVVGCLN